MQGGTWESERCSKQLSELWGVHSPRWTPRPRLIARSGHRGRWAKEGCRAGSAVPAVELEPEGWHVYPVFVLSL